MIIESFATIMWKEIKTQNDIENLMQEYFGFHDSCIVSVLYQSGAKVDENEAMLFGGPSEHIVDIVLHSQWKPPVTLRFTGVRKCNIAGWHDNYSCEIYEAYIAFHTDLLGKARDDRLVVWADGHFNPSQYIEEKIISPTNSNLTYVVAEKMFWQTVSNL